MHFPSFGLLQKITHVEQKRNKHVQTFSKWVLKVQTRFDENNLHIESKTPQWDAQKIMVQTCLYWICMQNVMPL